MEQETRWHTLAGHAAWWLAIASATFYIISAAWVGNWSLWYILVPFLLAEFGCFLQMLLWGHVVWSKRHHRPVAPLSITRDWSVDVFICTCREPLALLERTVSAATRIDWPTLQIYILDDGEDDAVEALAHKYGVYYLRRPTHEASKAGNLNYGLKHSGGDVVLALDADQVPEPQIVRATIGYFELPSIGLVQTQQRFDLPPRDPWGNSDVVFYRAMQPGKDADNAAISCGSGVLYRRKALQDAGGFSEWNIVEDLHTSLQIHDKGWRSVYHDTPFTTGTAPRDVYTQTKQRWQWAVDSLRMIFWDSPFRYTGLGTAQKFQYFYFGINYIVYGLLMPLFFLLPVYMLFSGEFLLTVPVWAYVAVRLPYLLLYMLANRLMTDHTHSFKAFQQQASLFPTYFHAIVTALRSRNHVPAYQVTAKTARSLSLGNRLRKTWPHLIVVGLSLAAAAYALVSHREDIWFVAVGVVWCLWTVAVLSRYIILSLAPQWMIREA